MKLQEGLVSIVTPAFNSAKTIGETIESVQAQSYPNWEMLIVIDSGTKDNTAQLVQSFAAKDPRIQLHQITDARGISLSRNLALRTARGQYVAFLDSDDLWLPEKLATQVQAMRAAGASFACTGYRRINFDSTQLGFVRTPPERIGYSDLLRNNQISCPTVLFDQQKLGRFQMQEHAHEDYILWLEIIKKAGFCLGIPQDLARYRIVENSRSMNVNRPGSRWKVYRNFEKLGLFSSCFYFCCYALTALYKRLKH